MFSHSIFATPCALCIAAPAALATKLRIWGTHHRAKDWRSWDLCSFHSAMLFCGCLAQTTARDLQSTQALPFLCFMSHWSDPMLSSQKAGDFQTSLAGSEIHLQSDNWGEKSYVLFFSSVLEHEHVLRCSLKIKEWLKISKQSAPGFSDREGRRYLR